MQFLSLLPLCSLVLGMPTTLDNRDANPGCQQASFSNPLLIVTDLAYSATSALSPSYSRSRGEIAFTIGNPALDYTGSCVASSKTGEDAFKGDVDYPCHFPSEKSATATFRYTKEPGQLNVTMTWVCSDTDAEYPCVSSRPTQQDRSVHDCLTSNFRTRFTAKGGSALKLDCDGVDSRSRRVTRCDGEDISMKPYEMTAVA
jgi:hypothetical protein